MINTPQAVHSANSYSPLQAPKATVDLFNFIKDPNRRKFAAMLFKLDESVGRVVEALQVWTSSNLDLGPKDFELLTSSNQFRAWILAFDIVLHLLNGDFFPEK